MFIRQAEVDLIEGDDLIALYVQMKEKDEQVIIFSRDKDYYQLIDENVYVLLQQISNHYLDISKKILCY